ncbi:MAG: response regulator [Planctomycetota bacterium]|nr:response regulator [Planctomycetota bacterium]
MDSDERSNQTLIQLLKDAGHEPLLCGSVAEASAILQADHVGACVIDCQVPGFNWAALVREFRDRHPGQAVVLTHTFWSQADRQAAWEAGSNALLTKPYAIDDLLKQLS